MSVRKEMLERELNKLGFRNAGQGGGREGAVAQQQQQPQPQSDGGDHPQAGENPADHSE
jgi:hypothetical protein